jgi:subtilisin-like proprotein convertase family protein
MAMIPRVAVASVQAQEALPPAKQNILVFLKGWSSLKIEISSDVAWGDVDGDGDLDLAVGNYGGPTRVYRNQGGVLDIQPIWSTGESARTKSVAWGDVDGDGNLDLAVGNYGSPTRVYKNQGGTLDTQPFWSTVEPADTNSVAWGDLDGDGDLDLAVGNTYSPTCVYQNQNGTLDSEQIWRTDEFDDTQSVAWGDVDGDGDLDLAVGNYDSPTRVYENRGGILDTRPMWNTAESAGTLSIAWGDMDGDGDLDLAVGNDGSPTRVYKNQGGLLDIRPVWRTDESARTESVIWGDVDNDGDLDLAVGNYSGLTRVYRNDNGELDLQQIWSTDKTADTTSVAWGDVDGDGNLDLAIGNTNSPTWVYYNQYNSLSLEPTWSTQGEVDDTRSVALGDMDGDGDLDLAVGNFRSPTKVYKNRGGMLDVQPIWIADRSDDTRSVAWGDVDSDGDLDLAVGSDGGSPTRVYKNLGGMLDTQPTWSTYEPVGTKGVAWGDMDGDGDLDLALGNWGHPTQVYENRGGKLNTHPIWSTEESVHSNSVAWGDIDNDGDLDLAVGNSNSPTRVYMNRGGMLDTQPAWSTDESAYTQSVAWGDVDGDGDLDLAVGNDSGPTRVYQNHGGMLDTQPMWSTDESDPIRSVAWGDIDGDGDLDLAVGNRGQPTRLYLNQGGNLGRTAAWSADDGDHTTSVAWGDVDGDGDLDLVVGNDGQRNKMYRNSRPAHPLAAGQSPETIVIHTSYYGLPIIHSGVIPITYTLHHPLSETIRSVKAMFSLDGGGRWQEAKPVTGTQTSDLATLPYPQVAVTNTHVFHWDVNASGFFGQSDNVVVRLVAYPSLKPRKNGIPGLFQRPFVSVQTFPFRVRGNQVKVLTDAVTVSNTDAVVYRLPAGKERGAEPLGGIEEPFRTSSNGFLQGRAEMIVNPDEQKSDRLVAIWPSAYVTQTMPTRNYISQNAFPITATAKSTIASGLVVSDARRIADIGMWVNISATLPVTLQANLIPPRGDPRHIISDTAPLSATLLVFEDAQGEARAGCDAQIGVCNLFAENLTGLRGSLADGAWTLRVANPTTRPVQLLGWGLDMQLSPLHFTSAKPIETGLKSAAVTAGGVQTLTVSSQNPLLLFDLNVALEWNASNDEQYMTQLSADLRRASELLYDWSNGQVALGNVRVYHDGRRNLLPDGTNAWNNAHIRIYASNRLRPNADQGGIISEAVPETVTISNTTKEIAYLPGQVRIGSVWNRYGDAFTRNLGDDWSAALAHELGHYLLFLDDNYLSLNQDNLIVPLSEDACPGAMNNPYSNVYSEFHPARDWASTVCTETLSGQNTGRSDWETITRFYPWLIAPTEFFTEVMQGPSLLPLAVTQVTFQAPGPDSDFLAWLAEAMNKTDIPTESLLQTICRPGGRAVADKAGFGMPSAFPVEIGCPAAPITSTAPLEVPIFYLKPVEGGGSYRASSQTRAFLFSGPPYRILVDLGQPNGDQVIARGARPTDRLCVFDLGNDRVGCKDVVAGDDQVELLEKDPNWAPEVIVSPVTSRTLLIELRLPLTDTNQDQNFLARVYPMDRPALDPVTMMQTDASSAQVIYTAAVTAEEPVLEGYVWVGMVGGMQDPRQMDAKGPNPRQTVTDFAIGGNPVRIKALLAPADPREVRIKALLAPRRAQRVRIRALLAPAASPDGQVLVYPDEDVLNTNREWSFTLQPATRLPAELPWATPVGRAYWLATSATITDVGKSSITFEYRASDVPPGEEPFLRLYFWEQDLKKTCDGRPAPCWRKLDSKPDLASNLISAPLQGRTGAGLYALLTSIELPLQPGWNLIGYPVQTAGVPAAARPISDVLASIAGAYSVVYGYEATDARDPWKIYAPRPDIQNDLAALDFGRGYWLHVTATKAITLHLRGSLSAVSTGAAPSAPALAPAMPPARPPITFRGHLTATASFAPKAGMAVLARVDGNDCGQGQTYADGRSIAYQITVGGVNGAVANRCGGPGSQVVFYVNGREMAPRAAWRDDGLAALNLTPAGAK